MIIDIQEEYEEILGAHWHKLYDLNELIATNKNNHPYRLQSIKDRTAELSKIADKKAAMELLFVELVIPKWYNSGIERAEAWFNKVEL